MCSKYELSIIWIDIFTYSITFFFKILRDNKQKKTIQNHIDTEYNINFKNSGYKISYEYTIHFKLMTLLVTLIYLTQFIRLKQVEIVTSIFLKLIYII